jgi:HEAT repeat protein
MSALENDENPGIRVSAIDALTPLTQDEATEEVVQEATRADPNGYVRTRALQYVGR